MTGPKVQRLVIGVAAAVMLVAGAGLAWAAGLNTSTRASVPVVVTSNRPLYAQVDTATAARPITVTKKAPAKKKSPSVTVTKKTNRSTSTTTHRTTVKKPTSVAKKPSTAKTHDEHETVKPPVRDEDDDDDEDHKPKSSDSRQH